MPDDHRQVVVRRNGGPDRLRVEVTPTHAPQGDQVRVRVRAAGVAFGDVLLREGIRRQPRPPLVPGYDVAGVVDAVGPDGPTHLLGVDVVAWTGGHGGYSEVVTVDPGRVVPYEGLPPDVAVALVLNYVTAHQMLFRVARVRSGDRILVHGAGGGVGTALLQLARHARVEVIGIASAGKHDLVASLGAHPVDPDVQDFVQVAQAAGGVRAAFDPVGGQHWRRSTACLDGAGMLVGYGFAAATISGRRRMRAALPALARSPWSTPLTLMQSVRSTAGYRIEKLADEHPDWFREDLTLLLQTADDGHLQPLIDRTLPLEDAAAAHQLLADRTARGKLILTATPS